MRNFYVPPNQISSEKILITGNEKHHIINVLRLSIGDEICILDGSGNSYRAVLTEIDSEKVIANVINSQYTPLPSFHLTLIQGLPKFNKMDFIVQKSVELGVDEIVPVICHRTVPKLSKKSTQKRMERWNKIAIEAGKQSGRKHFPTIHPIVSLAKYDIKSELKLIFWVGEKEKKLKKVLQSYKKVKSVSLLIGPEGGFTDKEIEKCVQSGVIPVSFGDQILRTETAAIAGLTILLYEFDRFS